MKKVIQHELEVQPIQTPNFILIGEENKPVPIYDFSEDEIEELCEIFRVEMHIKRTKKILNK